MSSTLTGTPTAPLRLTRQERTASMTLGAVFALRLLGIFLILPVFSVWAQTLEGGSNAFMVGLALGVYGLTQAVLQIPFGAASDRFGRKPVIVTGLLIFIFGSLLAYTADDITTLLFARALQGAGAVSAAVTAMISDSVRDKLLTRAMAFVGASIGISFTFSLVLAPVLADSIGVPGIFLLTAVLCVLAIAAVLMLPTAPVKRFEDFQARAGLRDVFLHGQLMRLNLGIFSLHMAQMALFVVIPLRLVELDLAVAHHWTVYLPAVLVSLAFLMPVLKHAEKKGRTKELFVGAICLVLVAFAGFEIFDNSVLLISVLLLVFFSGFNVLEASLPSLVSKTAPQECKGLALGVYNTTQSVGVFIGGAAGGWLYSAFGTHGVYGFCAALMILWIIAAQGMTAPTPRNVEADS